ncbi:copia protein [Tanacetum coccineum]
MLTKTSLLTPCQEVSSIVKQKVRVIDDTESDWSKMEKSTEVNMLNSSYSCDSLSYNEILEPSMGKKVAYHVVANYVRNTRGKYGLVRSMFSSSTRLFSFQFSSIDGLDAMLENVWVKLHGVPIMAFSEDGLSAITTKLVTIELRADVELKDNIIVAMPKITREGHYICNVDVEYEWKPLRCSSCKVFGHIHKECPKNTGAGEKKTMKKPSQTS